MATVKKLKRKFKMGSIELPDPGEKMAPEEVMRHYAPNYSGVLDFAVVKGPEVDGDCLVYTFEKPPVKEKG